MKPTETLTLQAFLVAVSQIDSTLPEELQRSIHQIGHALANHQTAAIANIRSLVKKHSQLNELYEIARTTLQRQYQSGDRNSPAIGESDSLTITLEDMAAQILTTDDFKAAAKHQVRQAKVGQFGGAAIDVRAFLESLQKAVFTMDAPTIAVLKALERRPLSLENLSYTLQMPLEQMRAIVQNLWSAGYIDNTKGNRLHKLFPALKRRSPEQQSVDSVKYFTLTAKGHFHLHPLITSARQKDTP